MAPTSSGPANYAAPGRLYCPRLPAALPAAGARRGLPERLRSLFSVFESIKRNVAGGRQPPKRLRESSCGDFHSLPQVLLKPLDVKDPVSFLPVPPSPVPRVSDLKKSRAASGLRWVPPGRALVIASHRGPGIRIPGGAEVVVVVEVITIRSMTIANN